MEHITRHSAEASVGLATAELILAIQKEFPHVRLVPCEPIEGEDIHLWAYLPCRLRSSSLCRIGSSQLNTACKRNTTCRRLSSRCQSLDEPAALWLYR